MQAELVWEAKAELGEGPHWDREKQMLYWVDITGRRIHAYHAPSDTEDVYDFDRMVSAVIPAEEGGLIVTLQDGIYRFHPEDDALHLLTEVEADLPRTRMNDAKCDPTGRLWAGTMRMDGSKELGALYVLERDGRFRQALTDIGCSNGLAWDVQRGRMYYIDTGTRRVDALDWDASTGAIANRRPAVRFPDDAGWPDGMTIDAEGMLWVGHWGGGRISRWDPDTGSLLAEVTVPALNVTSCTFGGRDLDELYITTAREGMSAEQSARYPLAGSLFKVRPGVRGTAGQPFGS
ncbi:SMP-30/gluconolactonase/LRE family protein [Paenibacillus filicis]|uniref:SMP-30/gluconolactonase/LRE family protein n=1 Tax=Paenibacillus filicis TaxID=669464 RepID=A0ABU9DM84_9BACL